VMPVIAGSSTKFDTDGGEWNCDSAISCQEVQ
jgi:hypothetical protein